jgi:hypothetical protein
VDRVHGTSINVSHSSGDLRQGLNEPKWYPALLILAVDAGMDDPRRLGRQRRRDRGGMPGPRLRIAGVGRYRRAGGRNTTRKKAKQRGDHGGAHLGQQTAQRAAVVALSGSGDGGCSMRRSSGSKKTTGSFVATCSSSSRLQLR